MLASSPMPAISAFGDDALSDSDAIGIVEAIRSGTISRAEAVEAAILRAEKANPDLNALAYQAFDRARDRATAPNLGLDRFAGRNLHRPH